MSAGNNIDRGFDVVETFWSFFKSLKLSVVLFILIGLLLVAGTFLPQNLSASMFAEMYPALFSTLKPLGFFDIYHSLVFSLLTLLLGLNLLACTIDRLPLVLKRFRERDPDLGDNTFSTAQLAKTVELPPGTKAEDEIGRAAGLMTQLFGTFKKSVTGEKTTLWHDSGRFSRLSVLAVHAGVITILCGALFTSGFGYEGTVTIPEGGTANEMQIEGDEGGQAEKTLPFAIRCERFTFERFSDGSPKSYRSLLSIIENGQVVKKAEIAVNSPMTHRGLGLYQSYFREDETKTVINIGFAAKDGTRTASAAGRVGGSLKPDGSWITGTYRITGYISDFEGFGPAAKVSFTPVDGKTEEFLLFKNHPAFDAKNRHPDVVLKIDGVTSSYATGLSIAYDPGAELVFLGALVLLLGLFASLLTSHKQVWVSVSQERIRVAATSSKKAQALTEKYETLVKMIERDRTCKP